MITVEMIEALSRKVDGVLVVNSDGSPEVRSRVRYHRGQSDEPDPLDTGEQLIVVDSCVQQLPGVTDAEIAADLTERWDDLVAVARERAEVIGESEIPAEVVRDICGGR